MNRKKFFKIMISKFLKDNRFYDYNFLNFINWLANVKLLTSYETTTKILLSKDKLKKESK